MSDFTPLPIYPGQVGKYHLNRFRICVAPGSATDFARMKAISANLLAKMPAYMNPHTAKVAVDPRSWQGNPTLRFVGVARLKPFSVPIYDPIHGRWIDVPMPEKFRDWAIPDVHPDIVGVEAKTATSFMA